MSAKCYPIAPLWLSFTLLSAAFTRISSKILYSPGTNVVELEARYSSVRVEPYVFLCTSTHRYVITF